MNKKVFLFKKCGSNEQMASKYDRTSFFGIQDLRSRPQETILTETFLVLRVLGPKTGL